MTPEEIEKLADKCYDAVILEMRPELAKPKLQSLITSALNEDTEKIKDLERDLADAHKYKKDLDSYEEKLNSSQLELDELLINYKAKLSALNDRWVKVDYSDPETFPKEDGNVNIINEVLYDKDAGFLDEHSNQVYATHWQPLPSKPQ